MQKTLSGRLHELTNKGKAQLGNPKSSRGRLRELLLQSLRRSSNGVFAKVVITRAGHLHEWSQGEFRLYSF